MRGLQISREAKKKADAAEHKAKMERAELRAAAPAFRRKGKPPMTRSRLQTKKPAGATNIADRTAESELQQYIDREYP